MNVLFVSAVLPYPLYSGGQVRIYNLLKRLSVHHLVTLFAFIRSEEERKYLKELSFCADVQCVFRGRAWRPSYLTRSLVGSYPFLMNTYDISEMREKIEKELQRKKYDLVHIEPGYVWPSLPELHTKLIVSEHNIEHSVYNDFVNHSRYPLLKQFMQRDVEKLKKWETIIWKKADHVVTVSDEDAEEIKKVKKSNVDVIPNGIDENVFLFRPKSNISESCTCLFVGNFRWIQNIDAVRLLLTDIWPSINQSFPQAKLRIVGKYFPKKFFSFISQSVSVIPHVEDITQEFNIADIVLAPIRVGGGTKYKILEAMASGVPVITTEKGIQGLPLKHMVHCYVANTENEWVKHIHAIINNKDINKKIVQNARALVEKEYSWNSIADELSAVWNLYAER